MAWQAKKACEADLAFITAVIEEGRSFLAGQGVDQWQKGEPNEAMLAKDIRDGNMHVLVEDGAIVAAVSLCFGSDADYADHLHRGLWGSSMPYAAIHRLAASRHARGSGAVRALLEEIERLCRLAGVFNIRVDTHPGNVPMQRFLQKSGFSRRGVIYLQHGADKGAKRVTFDKQLARCGLAAG